MPPVPACQHSTLDDAAGPQQLPGGGLLRPSDTAAAAAAAVVMTAAAGKDTGPIAAPAAATTAAAPAPAMAATQLSPPAAAQTAAGPGPSALKPISIPNAIARFKPWLWQLAALGHLVKVGGSPSPEVLVRHCLWPTGARTAVMRAGHMMTTSGWTSSHHATAGAGGSGAAQASSHHAAAAAAGPGAQAAPHGHHAPAAAAAAGGPGAAQASSHHATAAAAGPGPQAAPHGHHAPVAAAAAGGPGAAQASSHHAPAAAAAAAAGPSAQAYSHHAPAAAAAAAAAAAGPGAGPGAQGASPGSPSKKRKRLTDSELEPRPGRRLQEEDRVAYTLEVWAYRVLVAGVWRAVEARAEAGAGAGEEEGRLDLTDATVEDLLRLTWAAYRPLAPGESRPPGTTWAPDWCLDEDYSDFLHPQPGQVYLLPQLVQQEEDLRGLVIGGGDGGDWLLMQYQGLARVEMKGKAVYSFLRVDVERRQLVVNLGQLFDRVVRWGLRAAQDLAQG